MLRKYLIGNKTDEIFSKNLMYILFLALLGLLYITNSHQAEAKVREVNRLNDEIKEAQWRYMSIKSDFMYHTKRSAIKELVNEYGLTELKEKPLVIRPHNKDKFYK